jgi:hypothetical protein
MQLRTANMVWMSLWLLGLTAILAARPVLRSPWFVLVPASASGAMSVAGFNMHIPFGLAAATFGLLWYAWERDRSDRSIKLLAIFFLAVAICSVEYSLFLVAALGVWEIKAFWTTDRSQRREWLMRRLRDTAWLLGFMLLLWPAGIIKAGVLKAYALQGFLVLFRLKEAEGSYASLGEMIQWKWNASPLELGLGAVAIIVILWRWREVWQRGSLFVTLSLLGAIMYTQLNPVLNLSWYLFPVFAVTYVFYLDVIAERFVTIGRNATVLAVTLTVLLFGVAQAVVQTPYDPQMHQLRDAVAALPERPIIATWKLTPQLSAYFPNRRVRGIHDEVFRSERIGDSLMAWRQDHILVLPGEVRIDGVSVARTHNFAVYAPLR